MANLTPPTRSAGRLPVREKACGEPPGMLPHPLVVLVIEPSLTLRTLLPIMLRRFSQARVIAFPDALAALRHLRDSDLPAPDVILLTKDLPRLPGYVAARRLTHRYPGARIVMAMEDEGCLGRTTARLAGAVDIVLKPYTLQELQRLLTGSAADHRDGSTTLAAR